MHEDSARPHWDFLSFSRALIDTHLRSVRIVLALVLTLLITVLVGITATLSIAGSALRSLIAQTADGTRLSNGQLVLGSSWSLVIVAMMFAAGVAYIGMMLRSADAAQAGQSPQFRRIWRATVGRLPQASLVVIVVAASIIATVAAAPLISVGALAGLAGTPLVQRSMQATRWPHPRTLLRFAVPFVAAAVVTVRLSMAIPEVFLAGRNWRAALQAGWLRTAGNVRTLTKYLATAIGMALAGSWALIGLATLIGSRWLSVAFELSGSVLFAPLPFVAIAMLFVASGGTVQPVGPVQTRQPGPVMPSLLTVALVATLVVPSAVPARADTGDVGTDVAIDAPTDGAVWTYGDAPEVTGSVFPASGSDVPSGLVTLHAELDPNHAPESAELFTRTVTLDANGEFAFDEPAIPGITHSIWVTYDGDEVHAPSESAKIDVTVEARSFIPDISIATDGSPLEVGDTIQIIAEIAGGDMLADYPLDKLEFIRRGGITDEVRVIGQADIVADGADYRSVIEYRIVDRYETLYFQVRRQSDERNYVVFMNGDGVPLTADQVVAPAASTVELIGPAEVEYGALVTLRADVTGPHGMLGHGTIRFKSDSGSGYVTLSSGHTLVNGMVEVTFCASNDDDVCPPGGHHRLPFATNDADPISIRAEFLPVGLNTSPASHALASNESALHALALNDLGIGACRQLDLSPRIVDGEGRHTGYADPRVLTEPNCEGGGYLGGTSITLDAAPADGFELVSWRFNGQEVSTSERFVLQLPADEVDSERIEIYYQPVCHSVDIEIAGSASLQTPAFAIGNPFLRDAGDCELADGAAGIRHMSQAQFVVRTDRNPTTTEFDVLYDYGSPTINHELLSVTSHHFSSSRHRFAFTVDRDLVIPIEFGPVCRSVLTPSGQFGTARLLTAPNCASPDGAVGFARNSAVTAAAEVDDASVVLAGWLRDGERVFAAGRSEQATFTVGGEATTTIELEFATCHDVEVVTEAEQPHRASGLYLTEIWPTANCYDNSGRWLDGTRLRLTPWGTGTYEFSGWSDPDGAQGQQVQGEVDEQTGVRTVVLSEPLITTAHFRAIDSCSSIRVLGVDDPDDVHFPGSGCGPGFYRDEAKRTIARSNDPVTRDDYAGLTYGITSSRIFSETPLVMEIRSDNLLAATGWMSMRQEFEQGPAWTSGPPVPIECEPAAVSQQNDGSWSKDDVTRCYMMVRGDVTISLRECQGLEPTVNIIVAGDDSETVLRPAAFGLQDHPWIQGTVSRGTSCAHPDAADQNLWIPDREVTLRAHAPAFGFEFLDWGHVDFDTGVELFIGEDPRDGKAPLGVNVMTNDSRPTIRAEVTYRAHCAPLTVGHSVRILDPRPNCPGNRAGEMNYLVGSFVQVSANHTYGGRNFERFYGVVANSLGLDDDGRPSALVLIKDQNHVRAHYPDGMDRFVSALGTVGKPMLGIATLAALAGVSVACPPCGVALTALTASAFLLDLIPGIGGMASAALDLVNPLSILECTAKWGFGNTTPPSEASTIEGAGATGSTAIKSIRFAYEASTDGTERAVGTISARSSGRIAGASAQFAYGLYEHRIDQIDLDYKTTEDLRDTATWNNCLNDKYRAVA